MEGLNWHWSPEHRNRLGLRRRIVNSGRGLDFAQFGGRGKSRAPVGELRKKLRANAVQWAHSIPARSPPRAFPPSKVTAS